MFNGLVNRCSGCLVRFFRNHLHSGYCPLRDYEKNEKKNFWPLSWRTRNEGEEKLKIIKPREMDCDEKNEKNRILDPRCKVAIVLGGAADMGLSAADSLLYHGARAVILADEDPRVGEIAARALCDFYGKNRARFLRCDLRKPYQLEGVFEESICRYKRIDVLLSNIDRKKEETYRCVYGCSEAIDASRCNEQQLSITARTIKTGIKYMGRSDKNKNGGGIIVSCSSIIGFMGWPGTPTPVYCYNKEPVAETTIDLAKMYPMEKTGVRIVAILKSQRPFDEIGLPDFPIENRKIRKNDFSSENCEPSAESRIGKALIHVMSRASTGTTWLSEPVSCAREIPWQIYFPLRQGETVAPEIYEKQRQNYTTAREPSVAPSTADCPSNCQAQIKCKKLWKTRDR